MGVHANDFLTLQQFLPQIVYRGTFEGREHREIRWNQSTYGHPGNWDEVTAQFCLKTFLDVIIKLQSASWIPTPLHFSVVYEQKIEAVEDDVPVWNMAASQPNAFPLLGNVERKVITILAKGETLFGTVRLEKDPQGLVELLRGEKQPKEQNEELFIMTRSSREIFGYVGKAHVKVTCVPRKNDFVNENFPNLPEILGRNHDSFTFCHRCQCQNLSPNAFCVDYRASEVVRRTNELNRPDTRIVDSRSTRNS